MQAQILHAVNTTSRGRGSWVEAVYAECQVLRTKLSEKSVKQEAFVLPDVQLGESEHRERDGASSERAHRPERHIRQ